MGRTKQTRKQADKTSKVRHPRARLNLHPHQHKKKRSLTEVHISPTFSRSNDTPLAGPLDNHIALHFRRGEQLRVNQLGNREQVPREERPTVRFEEVRPRQSPAWLDRSALWLLPARNGGHFSRRIDRGGGGEGGTLGFRRLRGVGGRLWACSIVFAGRLQPEEPGRTS